MQQVGLLNLPAEVINYIFAHLSIPESAATRQLSTFFNKLDRTVESKERFLNLTFEDFTFIYNKGNKRWHHFIQVHQSSLLLPLIQKVYLSSGYLWVRPPKDIIDAIEHLNTFIDHYAYFKNISSTITISHACTEEINKFVRVRVLAWKNKFNIPSENWIVTALSSTHLFETVWLQTKDPLHGTYLGIAQAYGRNTEKVAAGVRQLHAMAPHCSLAKFVLGLLHTEGKRVEKDLVKTVNWWRSAAEQGDAEAQYALGKHYESEKSQQEALHWFRLAANQNHPLACNSLGVAFEGGNGVKQDEQEAVRLFRIGAEKGCSRAQYNLGLMYQGGRRIAQNDLEALHWIFLSAKQGDNEAQYQLGCAYKYGLSVEKNLQEAVRWFTKAANLNHALSQYTLGLFHFSGYGDYGVEKNKKTAVEWFRKAAENSLVNAQNSLAYMYVNGFGAEKNFEEAVKWYRKAAEQNSSLAKLCLGILLQPSLKADQLFEEGRDALDDPTRSWLINDATDLTKQIRKKLR